MFTTHEEAIAALGFVHERLPSSHPGAGSWFTLAADFHSTKTTPSIRVTIDSDSTELHVFDGHLFVWGATFNSNTPATVINQAVAAAKVTV